MKMGRKGALRTLLLSCCLAMPSLAHAQNQSTEGESLEDIIVTGEIQYRNRTDTVAPELTYDQQYFERFEPLSVGDQLARVPGIAFTSDIGEHDAPQMRGLGEGFTQVLINGRPIPGAGNDRTVFVDRIPAEIIDRVEIVRSPSADIDSQGIGGTINIILKDGMSLPPGVIVRVGAFNFVDESETRPLGAISASGRTDDRRFAYSATFDYQERYNVKTLDQELFDDTSPGFDPDSNGLSLFDPDGFTPDAPSGVAVEHEDQIDTRDSRDISFNGDLTFDLNPNHSFRLDGFYLNTDREETESAILYARDDEDGNANDDVSDEEWEVDEIASQLQQTDQTSYGASLLYEGTLSQSWSVESQLRYANFKEDTVETDFEDEDAVPVEQLQINSDDTELSWDGSLTFNSDAFAQRIRAHEFEFEVGVSARRKERDFSQREFEDDNEDGDFDDDDDDVTPGSGVFAYEENRLDGFVQAELQITEGFTVQGGGRLETTDIETSLPDGTTSSADYSEFNPSLHLQWDVLGQRCVPCVSRPHCSAADARSSRAVRER